MFGDAAVPLRVISETQAECYSPVGPRGPVSLGTTTTRRHITAERVVDFLFDEQMHIVDITPRRGVVQGGSLLSIAGQGFPASSDAFYCRFCFSNASSLVTSLGSVVSESLAVCRSPASASAPAGYAIVEVSLNLREFTANGHAFSFDQPKLTSLRPERGPRLGGTLVTMSAFGSILKRSTQSTATPHARIHADHPWSCEFGTDSSVMTVPATHLSASDLMCVTPTWSSPDDHEVAVSVTGLMLGEFPTRGLAFIYHPDLVVSSTDPIMGPMGGGTRVAVRGHGFAYFAEASFCRFRQTTVSALPGLADIGTIVPAKLVADDHLNCIAPPAATAEHVYVEISMNGVDFSKSRVAFSYFLAPRVMGVQPAQVAMDGGSRMSSPPGRSNGNAIIEDSNSALDFANAGVQISSVETQLSLASPANGPIVGGTLVAVSGAGV